MTQPAIFLQLPRVSVYPVFRRLSSVMCETAGSSESGHVVRCAILHRQKNDRRRPILCNLSGVRKLHATSKWWHNIHQPQHITKVSFLEQPRCIIHFGFQNTRPVRGHPAHVDI